MAHLTDDARYALALEAQERIAVEELAAFRTRVADRVTGMVAAAMDEMAGGLFDERQLRKALAGYDGMYVEESMRYIERVLLRGGQIEAAKRVSETAAAVGLEAMPEAFQQAHEELDRAGLLDEYRRRGLEHVPVDDESKERIEAAGGDEA